MVKVIVTITIIIINIIINDVIITITDEELDNLIINYLMKIKVVYMEVEICYLMKMIMKMKLGVIIKTYFIIWKSVIISCNVNSVNFYTNPVNNIICLLCGR